MKVVVTGSAGFIGSHLTKVLLNENFEVLGIDNHNDYYDPSLKEARLANFIENENYSHKKINLEDKKIIEVIQSFQPKIIIHLAAQAGVRYSLKNPYAYLDSNIYGFMNILEASRSIDLDHLLYASSSSVYGGNLKLPFSEKDSVDHPVSLYAATKKSNELMAHTYSHLFDIPTTGLRFFTVYGPWGRPDMALFLFTKAILEGKAIDVFNHGEMVRDFTYVDDIVDGVYRLALKPPKKNSNFDMAKPNPSSSTAPYKIFNIGNSEPRNLIDYINAIASSLNKDVKMNFLPIQLGDVPATHADTKLLDEWIQFKPKTSIEDGIKKFCEWYLEYFSE